MSRPPLAVASGHSLTTTTIADVLQAGGNAADGAVAGALMACVCEPVLAGLAGGGAAMLHDPSGRCRALDFFSDTPRRKRPLHEIDFREIWADFGTTRQAFHIGAGSIATPSMLPGLAELHERSGRMPWRELVAPAMVAARDGVVVTPHQAKFMGIIAPICTATAPARAIFAPKGAVLTAGEIQRNPDMAGALDALAHEGARLASEGEIASAILEVAAGGGHLLAEDLAAYRPEWRTPILLERGGAKVALNPPPAMGGALVMFALAMLDHRPGPGAIADAFAATQEARVEAGLAEDAAEGTGRLASPDFIERYREMLEGRARARRGTTQISVIDGAGMGVSMTLTNGEGCGLIAPGTGIMPNNMLGEADLCPAGFHEWRAGARLSSNITPAAVRWPDGRIAMLGSGGSNRIRSAMAQVLLRLIDHGETPEDAVAAPRLHVEHETCHSEPRDDGARAALQAAWPDVTLWSEPSMFFGGVHVAMTGSRGAVAAGDPRRAGAAFATG